MGEMSKTPDEIKKGLECWIGVGCENYRLCSECPRRTYTPDEVYGNYPIKDALALIQQLERDKNWASENYELIREENKRLEAHILCKIDVIKLLEAQNAELLEKIKQLERERDAAVSELKHHCWNCKYHLNKPIEETDDYGRTIHRYCSAVYCFPEEENRSWEWRGPCEKNGGSDA